MFQENSQYFYVCVNDNFTLLLENVPILCLIWQNLVFFVFFAWKCVKIDFFQFYSGKKL